MKSALNFMPPLSESFARNAADGALPALKAKSAPMSAFEFLKSRNPAKSMPRSSDEAFTLRLP